MDTAQMQFKQGRDLLHARRYDDAIPVFLALAATAPEFEAECYFQISMCYFNMDHTSEREEPWLHRALAVNPDHEGALNTLTNRYRGTPAGAEYHRRLLASYRKQGMMGPEDTNDVAGWDSYWTINTKSAWNLRGLSDCTEWLIAPLQARRCQTILCVGNGIHLEPRAFACAGFTVTALDLSPIATAFAANYPFTPQQLGQFAYFSHLKEQPEALTAIMAAAPPVQYVTGNLFDPLVCSGRYDVVVTRRTLQLLHDHQLGAAIVRLLNRVSSQGVLINHVHNGAPPPDWLVAWLAKYNTPVFGRRTTFADAMNHSPDRRFVFYSHSSGLG